MRVDQVTNLVERLNCLMTSEGETMNLPAAATGEGRWGVWVLDADSARSALDVLDEAVDEPLVQQAGRRAVEILLAPAIEPIPVFEATAPDTATSPGGGVRTVPATALAAAAMTGPVGQIYAVQSALLMGHIASSALPHVVPVTAPVPMSAAASSTQPEPTPPTDLSSAAVGGADRAVT